MTPLTAELANDGQCVQTKQSFSDQHSALIPFNIQVNNTSRLCWFETSHISYGDWGAGIWYKF